MDIKIKIDFKGADALVKKAQKQAPFAAMNTTNSLLFQVRNRLVEVETHRHLDDVTNWTKSKKALMVSKAKYKHRIRGDIYIPKGREYLEWVIFGGTSKPYKPGQEQLVNPASFGKLNKYKNIPRGYVKNKATKPNFFLGTAGKHNTYGLWERWSDGRKLLLHANMKHKSRKQKRIFPADTIAAKHVQRQFGLKFRIEMRRAMKTAK